VIAISGGNIAVLAGLVLGWRGDRWLRERRVLDRERGEARADYAIAEAHLADAIERLVERSRKTLSSDRTPKNPY